MNTDHVRVGLCELDRPGGTATGAGLCPIHNKPGATFVDAGPRTPDGIRYWRHWRLDDEYRRVESFMVRDTFQK